MRTTLKVCENCEKSDKERMWALLFWFLSHSWEKVLHFYLEKPDQTTKLCVAFLLLISIRASLDHDYQQGSTASPRRWEKLIWQLC